MNITPLTTFQKKETALSLIAFASLKHWGEPTTPDNIAVEKARIERIIEDYYMEEDQEYNQFVLNFLKKNSHEIVYGDNFCGDVYIPGNGNPDSINGLEYKLIF